MAEMLRGILMFDHGDRVKVAGSADFPEAYGTVENDFGGEVVKVHIDGEDARYPHNATSVPRGMVTLARQIEDGNEIQIEIYSRWSTHTLYECCGAGDCRRLILHNGLGIPEDEVFERDQFFTAVEREPVRITVSELDEPSTCIWCYGCGDFIQHGTDDGGCECEERGHDPEEDREALRPMVVENGLLELRHW